jgi:WD40 repeat protein
MRDGRLVSGSDEGVVRIWSLTPDAAAPTRDLWAEPRALIGYWLELDAQDRFAVFSKRYAGQVFVQPLDGSRARLLTLAGARPVAAGARVDPMGTTLALSSYEFGKPGAGSIRVLDLASGEERILRPTDTNGACQKTLATFGPSDTPAWLPDGRLVSDGVTGLRVWNLADGSSRQLRPCRPSRDVALDGGVTATPDGRELLGLASMGTGRHGASDLYLSDLSTGATRDITSHGARLQTFALDRTGTLLVTGDADGLVRVGPLSGEEPHLLYGHARAVTGLAVSPDGKWIASGSDDDTIRLWPMPEGPPLHTLPYDALLAKLRVLTNLRVVPDANSPTGYKVEPGPFPSWSTVPEW